ncbi:MAG: cytochrome c3 family protein [Planctomycetes bacterium]|nr:cytochrome c3 family protein [Planctomycetota bacterium]
MSHPTLARRLLLAAPFLVGLASLPLAPQDPTAPLPRPGKLLGAKACAECHEDEARAIAAAHHRDVVTGADTIGCETCHGPGEAHGSDRDNDPKKITHPRKLAVATQHLLCEGCHQDQARAHRGDPGGFAQAGKGCAHCHKVHAATAKSPPHAGVSFPARRAMAAKARPIGAAACVACHPRRDELLAASHHASLAAGSEPKGCETCHGPGSLHAETNGIARLITRPDRALDGIETCRDCHDEVDPVEFHWRGKRKPLLGPGLSCTTCHEIHAPRAAAPAPRVDRHSGEPAVPATNALCATCHGLAFAPQDRPLPAALGPRDAEKILNRGHAALAGTIHARLGAPDTPLAQGCGACHAGAEAHARAGGRRGLVDSLRGADARHTLAVCGSCHQDDRALLHVRAGSHFRKDVSCTACHTPGAPAGREAMRRDAEKNCTVCHGEVQAEFARPNHHPVPEGRMACSDCHQPHSARPKLRDLQLREDACVSCHREYRGPFVYAHQASRSDGCVACHVPHGSSNRRMLQHSNPQQSCLQCHGDFPAFHDQTAGAVFTNCLNCHSQVHGSNHNRYLLR